MDIRDQFADTLDRDLTPEELMLLRGELLRLKNPLPTSNNIVVEPPLVPGRPPRVPPSTQRVPPIAPRVPLDTVGSGASFPQTLPPPVPASPVRPRRPIVEKTIGVGGRPFPPEAPTVPNQRPYERPQSGRISPVSPLQRSPQAYNLAPPVMAGLRSGLESSVLSGEGVLQDELRRQLAERALMRSPEYMSRVKQQRDVATQYDPSQMLGEVSQGAAQMATLQGKTPEAGKFGAWSQPKAQGYEATEVDPKIAQYLSSLSDTRAGRAQDERIKTAERSDAKAKADADRAEDARQSRAQIGLGYSNIKAQNARQDAALAAGRGERAMGFERTKDLAGGKAAAKSEEKPLTAGERQTAMWARQGTDALAQMNDLRDKGYDPTDAKTVLTAPTHDQGTLMRYLKGKSDPATTAWMVESRNLANSFSRGQTGAAMPENEIPSFFSQIIEMPGDPSSTVESKKQKQQAIVEVLQMSAGRGWTRQKFWEATKDIIDLTGGKGPEAYEKTRLDKADVGETVTIDGIPHIKKGENDFEEIGEEP